MFTNVKRKKKKIKTSKNNSFLLENFNHYFINSLNQQIN